MPTIAVTRTYLELTSRDAFRPARLADPGVQLERVHRCPADLYRHLYQAVGGPYTWIDRLSWTDREIEEHVARPDISIWVLRAGMEIAGYFELAGPAGGSAEIVYFGLVGSFQGRGLGKHLLTLAVDEAWAIGATRIWLHTCTLDHPAALPNYLRRGFREFRRETYTVEVPPRTTG
jgi:GNAT superfamily N-acetyltransferase